MSELNQQIFLLLYGTFGGGTPFEGVSTFLAGWLPFLLVACSVAYELYARDGVHVVRAMARVLLPSTVAVAAAYTIKLLSHFPRPYAVLDQVTPLVSVTDAFGSFPSMHATLFSALGVTMYLCNKQLGKWYIGAAVLVALGRVTAGVHWPIDVISGFIFGAVIAIVIEFLMRKFFPKLSAEC